MVDYITEREQYHEPYEARRSVCNYRCVGWGGWNIRNHGIPPERLSQVSASLY